MCGNILEQNSVISAEVIKKIVIDSRPYYITYLYGEEGQKEERRNIAIVLNTTNGKCILEYDPYLSTYCIRELDTHKEEYIEPDNPLALFIKKLVDTDLVRSQPFRFILSEEDKKRQKLEDDQLYLRVTTDTLLSPESIYNANPRLALYMQHIESIWREIVREYIESTSVTYIQEKESLHS